MSTSTKVVLETPRLLLREFDPADLDALFAVIGDPIAMQFYPEPFTRETTAEWIERNRRRYHEEGHGLWAMVLKDAGEMIGDCGLVLQRDVLGRDEIEVGYHVRRDHWKRGYATEAARACMRHAFENVGADRVISLIRPENAASRRVAEKNGLRVIGEITRAGNPLLVYAIERKQFEVSAV